MKHVAILLLSLVPLLSTASFKEYFTGNGLRVDYYHLRADGGERGDLAALSEVPFFAGNRINLVDTSMYGAYRVELHSPQGEVLFARGYSTLFNEWRTTEEAEGIERVFMESLIVPYPRHAMWLRLLYRDGTGEWRPMMNSWIDPSSMAIRHEKPGAGEVAAIHISGDMSEKVDILFLPEGYTASQREMFLADCERFRGYLMGCAPFSDRTGDFNFRAVWVESLDPGTDNPGKEYWARTAFNSGFYTFGSERYLTTQDYWSVMDKASLAPFDQIVLIVNTEKYGGGGVFNYFTVASAHHTTSDFLLVHEFGHAFAGLGDEYYTSDVAVEDFYPLHVEPWEPNLTTLVDFSSKWEGILQPGTAIPTTDRGKSAPEVGVYEGGGYSAFGVYRPAIDCTMKSVRYDDFCPVCTRAIHRMIDLETAHRP